VTANLEEAAGKALARRTEIAYEAATPGEEAIIFKARYLTGAEGGDSQAGRRGQDAVDSHGP